MGILGNFSRINLGAVRYNAGGALALTRGNLAGARPGLWRNALSRDGQSTALNLVANPTGAYPRLSWRMPIEAGMVGGIDAANITIGATGAGSMGVAASGSASITFSASGTGSLVSSASGTAAITIGATGNTFAALSVAGNAAVSIAAAGAISALGHVSGSAGITFGASWTPYAIGWLSGTTEEAGLTPTGIAAAVWQRAIEAGYTAEEILRILASVVAGSATGLEGANPQFTGLDGTTVRVDGAYSGGTRTIDSLDGA